MATSPTLVWADYLVIVSMLGISIGIGIYYRLTGGRQKTTEEYFSANRSMSIVPVAIALMVSFMSAITLLGVSAENYTYGTQFFVINLSYLPATPIICHGFLPVFFKLQATSVYEYLEKRFGMRARLMASFIYWIQLLSYSGVVLYAPSLALEVTTGLSKTTSIVAIGLVCAFYSSIGGIKAVLITDVFQAFLMFAALFVVIGTAASSVGGIGEIWRIAQEGGRLEFDNFEIDPTTRHTWWSLMLGGMCTYLSLYGVNQVQVQRLLTVKSLRAARISLYINWPITVLLSMLTCFSGLAIYSHYRDCDPKEQGRIASTDMLMPRYVMDNLSHLPGLPGLFVAGIFSAGLSTVSAALNSLAAVTLEDYVKPTYAKWKGKEFPTAKTIVLGKFLAFTFGILCIAIAFLAQFLGGVLQGSLTIFGVVGGPLLGLFTLGMGFESATESGAVISVLTSLSFTLWIAFGGPRPVAATLPVSTAGCGLQTAMNTTLHVLQEHAANPDDSRFFYLYRISYMWYAPIGFLMTLVIGLVVSNFLRLIIFRGEPVRRDPDLFFSCVGERMRKRRHLENGKRLPKMTAPATYRFDEKICDGAKFDAPVTHI